MKKFENPEIEVTKLEVCDVITASQGGANTGDGGTDIVNPFG